MTKKSVSFDAMVHFFMKHYNFPSKKDLEKFMTKLDRLETMVKQSYTKANGPRSRDLRTRIQSGRPGMTVSDTVLEIIKETGDDGAISQRSKIKRVSTKKKIRNVKFRLNKLGKIKRKNRGIYVAT